MQECDELGMSAAVPRLSDCSLHVCKSLQEIDVKESSVDPHVATRAPQAPSPQKGETPRYRSDILRMTMPYTQGMHLLETISLLTDKRSLTMKDWILILASEEPAQVRSLDWP